MGISVFPAAAGGGIKSVQRGSAGASGNVTITAVDIAKSFVTVFGSASSGTVSASFGLNTATMNFSSATRSYGSNITGNDYLSPTTNYAATNGTGAGNANVSAFYNQTANIANLSPNAGSNNLVSAVVTGFLANSTTLTVSGACRYEVVEFA